MTFPRPPPSSLLPLSLSFVFLGRIRPSNLFSLILLKTLRKAFGSKGSDGGAPEWGATLHSLHPPPFPSPIRATTAFPFHGSRLGAFRRRPCVCETLHSGCRATRPRPHFCPSAPENRTRRDANLVAFISSTLHPDSTKVALFPPPPHCQTIMFT